MKVLGIFVILLVFGGAMFILLKNYNSNMSMEEDDSKRKEEEERLKALPPRLHIKPADLVKIVDQEMTLGRQVDFTFFYNFKEHHLKVVMDPVSNKLLYMMDSNPFGSVNDMINRCLVDNTRFFSIYDQLAVTNLAYPNEPHYSFVGDERFAKYIVYGDNKEYKKHVEKEEWE